MRMNWPFDVVDQLVIAVGWIAALIVAVWNRIQLHNIHRQVQTPPENERTLGEELSFMDQKLDAHIDNSLDVHDFIEHQMSELILLLVSHMSDGHGPAHAAQQARRMRYQTTGSEYRPHKPEGFGTRSPSS